MTSVVDSIAGDLRRLGVASGDHVLVRAALAGMAAAPSDRARTLIRSLLNVVGDDGTIVALTFSNGFLRPKKHPDYVFDRDLPCATGGFAEAVRTWRSASRSRHPLNSFSAIGARSEELTRDHNTTSACFAPMEKLMAWDGKMILVGCVASSPGFSTVHLAQYHLGLSYRTWLSGLGGVLYRDGNGDVRTFTRRDIPGCSSGFSNYYSEYVKRGFLRTGTVGGAYSVAIDCKQAYDTELELLRRAPRSALCSNPACMFCRGTLYYNKRDWPVYFLRNGSAFLRDALIQVRGKRRAK